MDANVEQIVSSSVEISSAKKAEALFDSLCLFKISH